MCQSIFAFGLTLVTTQVLSPRTSQPPLRIPDTNIASIDGSSPLKPGPHRSVWEMVNSLGKLPHKFRADWHVCKGRQSETFAQPIPTVLPHQSCLRQRTVLA